VTAHKKWRKRQDVNTVKSIKRPAGMSTAIGGAVATDCRNYNNADDDFTDNDNDCHIDARHRQSSDYGRHKDIANHHT